MREQGVDLIVLIYSVDVANVEQLLDGHTIDLALHKDNYFEIESSTPYQPHGNDVFLTEPGVAAIIELVWQKGKPESLQLHWQKRYLNEFDKLPQVARQIAGYTARLNRLLAQPIGITSTPIDCRRLQLRTRENAFGNFLADSIKKYTGADIALINSGAIRGDKLYPADHSLTRRDIADILPYRAEILVLDVTGQQIIDAFENSFSSIERVKGRFLQVSGLKVVYNSSHATGKRVVSVQVNHHDIIADQHYQLATTDYLAQGGDGYSVFSNSPRVNNNKQVIRLLSDIAINQIIKQKIISPEIESRLTDLANAN
ncbi:bifunctional metallophosphatase/5'-nucleotidase [Neptunicella sp. SCSIO 80796]|uniref:bifunctional metallophosphatase/5'-nucleotidase n=1 Tax=Neptunicella plasticusilytica TaxID=3117012 RepID=UPI003A4E4D18